MAGSRLLCSFAALFLGALALFGGPHRDLLLTQAAIFLVGALLIAAIQETMLRLMHFILFPPEASELLDEMHARRPPADDTTDAGAVP